MSTFFARRILRALLLVFAVSSAALWLVHMAPGDAFSGFALRPETAAAERARFGLDRPFAEQYLSWMARAARLDFGESSRFNRPVGSLLRERAGNTLLLGTAALILAIALGVPAGVLTGTGRRRYLAAAVRALSLLLTATPPLVTALLLLLIASRTGWLPASATQGTAGAFESLAAIARYLPLPAIALALPVAAALERLQSNAIAAALAEPSVAAARARGFSHARTIWAHAWPQSLQPVVGVLGVLVGTVLSGSFVVEIVMSWPGLGDLMYQALVGRDLYLAAGCAAAGAAFLSLGLVIADVALMVVDPRLAQPA